MAYSSSASYEAVFLFQGDQILRELLYPEFEAILDGFIPIPEYAGTSAKAVYIQVNQQLCVTGMVFFLLGFDPKGIVDHRWNVPLQQMLSSAGPGPDMGAGNTRLVCYSQCPLAWHQKNLWDPQMAPGRNSFVAIKKVVSANRLGFAVSDVMPAANIPTLSTQEDFIPTLQPLNANDFEHAQQELQQRLQETFSNELRDKVAQLIKQQRLRNASSASEHQEQIRTLQNEHQHRLASYQQRLEMLEQQNKELDERNKTLKESLEVQANKIDGIREYFAHKLKAAQEGESNQFQEMQESFALEMEVKIQAATADLREMLEMREVELFYRHQNETALKEEIVALKRENQDLMKNAGDQLLGRLASSGVSFVCFQPGVGQLSIPVDDLSRYLDNPLSYIASKSGVDESLFIAWWEHYQNPCCKGLDDHGAVCGQSVARVGAPLEFHLGESDRCSAHQLLSYQRVADRR